MNIILKGEFIFIVNQEEYVCSHYHGKCSLDVTSDYVILKSGMGLFLILDAQEWILSRKVLNFLANFICEHTHILALVNIGHTCDILICD
jgi:hypothetical protein